MHHDCKFTLPLTAHLKSYLSHHLLLLGAVSSVLFLQLRHLLCILRRLLRASQQHSQKQTFLSQPQDASTLLFLHHKGLPTLPQGRARETELLGTDRHVVPTAQGPGDFSYCMEVPAIPCLCTTVAGSFAFQGMNPHCSPCWSPASGSSASSACWLYHPNLSYWVGGTITWSLCVVIKSGLFYIQNLAAATKMMAGRRLRF